MQNEPFKDVAVIGVEPKSLDIGLTLTPVVEAAVPQVVQAVVEQLEQWNVEVTPRI